MDVVGCTVPIHIWMWWDVLYLSIYGFYGVLSCQAGFFGQWSLVRHTAGILKKRVEDLGPVSGGVVLGPVGQHVTKGCASLRATTLIYFLDTMVFFLDTSQWYYDFKTSFLWLSCAEYTGYAAKSDVMHVFISLR